MGSDVGVRLSMHSCLIILLLQTYSYILSEDSAEIYSKLLTMQNSMKEDYAAEYHNNISVKHKGQFSEEDQFHKENIQDFKLVENRIDEILKGTKGEITFLFCNINTLKRKETQSILKFLKKKTGSNILVRILFPLGVYDRIINSYSEVANVRIFERKLENIDIYIISDNIKFLQLLTTDPIDYGKESVYAVTYSDNEKITYTYVTMFEKLWLLQTVTKLELK